MPVRISLETPDALACPDTRLRQEQAQRWINHDKAQRDRLRLSPLFDD